MTAREELIKKISDIYNAFDFEDKVKSMLQLFKIQMKKGQSKDKGRTAREELFSVLCEKRSSGEIFDIKEILSSFRIQSVSPRSPTSKKRKAKKDCEIVYMDAYRIRRSMIPTNYGYVAGGPPRKSGSPKVCPKCKSVGLHLAKGYKERYYSCIYCGFHQELEAKTYNY